MNAYTGLLALRTGITAWDSSYTSSWQPGKSDLFSLHGLVLPDQLCGTLAQSLVQSPLQLWTTGSAAYWSFLSNTPPFRLYLCNWLRNRPRAFLVVAEEGMPCLDFVISTRTILLSSASSASKSGQGRFHSGTQCPLQTPSMILRKDNTEGDSLKF